MKIDEIHSNKSTTEESKERVEQIDKTEKTAMGKVQKSKVTKKSKFEKTDIRKSDMQKVVKEEFQKHDELHKDYLIQTQQEEVETVRPLESTEFNKHYGVTKLEENSRMVAEINELLEVINAKEFGPGESPLRELAKIGYMLRSGLTIEEIESLYDSQFFPALRVPQSQSALVKLVERQGHSALITEVLTEETTQDEHAIAAKVGFRAFLKMVEMKHTSVEEVIAHFYPEDFQPRSWEQKEAHEVP